MPKSSWSTEHVPSRFSGDRTGWPAATLPSTGTETSVCRPPATLMLRDFPGSRVMRPARSSTARCLSTPFVDRMPNLMPISRSDGGMPRCSIDSG